MKSVTYFPLSPHGFKYVGIVMALSGLGLYLFQNQQYQLLLYTGLLVMVFSRERHESSFVAAIRGEVFKSVFGFTISLTIALHLTALLSEGFSADLPPLYYIGFPLLLYLILFNISLMLKVEVDSSLDFVENLKIHRRPYVVWALIVLVISLVLILRYAGFF
jgi:hypothetical protein